MRVHVRFFAGARDAAGASAHELDLDPGATLAHLLARLEREHPRLAPYRAHALYARNGRFVGEREPLREGDEVAFMPPVSGGAGARLDPAPFSLDALVESLRREGAGAVVAFEGLVRSTSSERPRARVVALEFEAYEALAREALAQVRDEAVAKFGLVDAALHHRLGTLREGEPVVAVVAAAAHRRAAFEAAAWMMDELKTRVPVWKREVDADGARHWVNDPTTKEGRA